MKAKLLFLLTLCLPGLIGNAQINVSTGLNGTSGAQVTCGLDANWKITSPFTVTPKVTTAIGGAWEPTPVAVTNAGWINVTCFNSQETAATYTYERDFTIAPGTSSFSCNFKIAYDDNLASLELIPPTGPAVLLSGPLSASYFLVHHFTNVVSSPVSGVWKIRAKVVFLDNLAAFLLSGYINPAQVVQDSTVYCCTGTNLLNNGNFEAGNVGFTSSYTFQPAVTANAVIPRQYNIVTSAQASAISPQWFVEDHTKCINGTNSKFLVVNGRTMQAAGTNSNIWDQTAPVTPNAEYKFCANVKNLAQCAFDIKPQIRVVITGGTWTSGSSAYQTINVAAGLCNWLQIGGCIKATGQQLRVQIFLLEDGVGDGNDLALDDISLQKKLDQPSTLSVQNQGGTPPQILASINSIATSDDFLVTTACNTTNPYTYQWFVYEVTAAAGFPMVPGTNAWSTNLAGFNNQTSLPVGPWGLTTTFPGYNFAPNKLYLIGLSIPSCCNSCYADKWMYQITGYFGFTNPPQYNMTEEMKDYIKAMIKEKPAPVNPNDQSIFKVVPNPSNGVFQVAFDKQTSGTITITDSKGGKIAEKTISNEKTTDFNLSDAGSGIYFIKLNSGDKVYTEKMIKQ